MFKRREKIPEITEEVIEEVIEEKVAPEQPMATLSPEAIEVRYQAFLEKSKTRGGK